MISYQTFLNQVDSLQPPVLKRFKKSVKLSDMQGVGLTVLVFFSILFLGIIISFFQKDFEHFKSNLDDVALFFIFFVFYICGWVGFVYSLKFSRQEKREEFQVKSSTRMRDTLVVIGAILVPSILDYSSNLWKPVCVIEVYLVLFYFLNPGRIKQIRLNKTATPLYRILSVLGVVWDPENPARFSLNNGISFESLDLTKKFGYYDDKKQFYMNYKGIVFTVPRRSVVESWDLKNRLEQFVCSLTGQALFFHPQILEIREEHDDKRLTFYFITYQGTGAQRPNWYQDKYFYYTREDLATIYNDVAQLKEIY